LSHQRMFAHLENHLACIGLWGPEMELFPFKKIATLYLDSCRGHFRRVMLLCHAYKYLIWVWSLWYICSFKIAALSNSTRCKVANKQSQYSLGSLNNTSYVWLWWPWSCFKFSTAGEVSPSVLNSSCHVKGHWPFHSWNKKTGNKLCSQNWSKDNNKKMKKVPDPLHKWWTQFLRFRVFSLKYYFFNQLLFKV
jgi:hypothetical protein